MQPDPALLDVIEAYYDEVPRRSADVEDLGPFALFSRRDPEGWPFYARPRLGYDGPFTADDVRRVRERQRALGEPEAFEWVHEVTPRLADVVRAEGLVVSEHPLMVLAAPLDLAAPDGVSVELLGPDDPRVAPVLATVDAAFQETDDVTGEPRVDHVRAALASGALRLAGAFTASGAVGGGSHSPRGAVTELTGIATLPRHRARGVGAAVTAALVRDAHACGAGTVFLTAGTPRVAQVYARVGFEPVATACTAEPARSDP